MKKLTYSIEDATIAEILGIQAFASPESAILELVKNAYDSGASSLLIDIADDGLVLSDSGQGMSAEDIESRWMCVGKSDKGYSVVDESGHERVLSGSKGVGRFALARLGKTAELRSKKRGSDAVIWETDWNTSTIDECTTDAYGTTIRIRGLRDTWSRRLVKSLKLYLSRMYDDDSMEITVRYGNEEERIENCLDAPLLGINCTEEINLDFDSATNILSMHINSNEFREDAQKTVAPVSIHKHWESLNMVDELYAPFATEMDKDAFAQLLASVGEFRAKFQFRLVSSSAQDIEDFLYQFRKLPNPSPSGVVLYRNAFSISGFDGTKDWLGLGRRARRSPASPSHPTGNWRVRENQLAGKVLIDKKKNPMIRDIANRQGIEENDQFQLLLEIIHSGLKVFERYRQGIIRAISATRESKAMDEHPHLTDSVTTGKITYEELGKQGFENLRQELKAQAKEQSEQRRIHEEVMQRQRYDTRVLNVLATSGLKAASIAHQLKNEENNIRTNSARIEAALKRYGLWDEVSTEERTSVAYRNIPNLLYEGSRLNMRVATLIGFMLGDLEKERFSSSCCYLGDVLEACFYRWKMDFSQICFEWISHTDTALDIPADVIQVMFDNLILNSIQQNPSQRLIEVRIAADSYVDNSFVKVTYSDNGVGLNTKYHANPMRILEVHETTRSDGHGLGMWILNNSLIGYGGRVVDIGIEGGFMISFIVKKVTS